MIRRILKFSLDFSEKLWRAFVLELNTNISELVHNSIYVLNLEKDLSTMQKFGTLGIYDFFQFN